MTLRTHLLTTTSLRAKRVELQRAIAVTDGLRYRLEAEWCQVDWVIREREAKDGVTGAGRHLNEG